MPNRIPADATSATFSSPVARVLEASQAEAKRSGVELPIRVEPLGNSALCLAIGRNLDVMRLIGALAAQGQGVLHKAALLGAH